MSAAVRIIPSAPMVDAAWDRYTAFARAYADNPALMTDRAHCEAMVRAFADWRDLYLASERVR